MNSKKPCLALVAAVVVGLSACASDGVLTHDQYGNELFRFNETYFHYSFQGSVDHYLKDEMTGSGPPAGFRRVAKTWEQFWLNWLHNLENQGAHGVYLTERHELYVAYIMQSRRAAGLPDLPGYASQAPK